MTFKELKKLQVNDFVTRNEEVWDAIAKLPLKNLVILTNHWNDEVIQDGIYEVASQKAEISIKRNVIDKLSQEQRQLFRDFIATNPDALWDIFRGWGLVN